MGGPEPRRRKGRRGPALGRASLLGWAACAAVVWNVVFDAAVFRAGREYLTLQALHQQNRAPAVTIRGVLEPAVGRAARTATLAGGTVGALGLLATWLAAGRWPRASARRAQ